MKITLASILLLFCFSSIGQVSFENLIQKADSAYFDFKDYNTALNLYEQIKGQLKPNDKDYNYILDKVAKSIFYLESEVSNKNDWQKSILLSQKFIDLITKEGISLSKELVQKKYWMYKNIVVGNYGLGQKDIAKTYQDILYQAYKKMQLPDGLNKYYCFEKFVYNNQNIWGYEWFAQLGDKETQGSFSKQVYYIYSRDNSGNDKDELYTLQTVKIHKLNNTEPDFVLTKRTNNGKQEISESIWTATFTDPIDYKKLHDAIVEYLKGNLQPNTKLIINKDE